MKFKVGDEVLHLDSGSLGKVCTIDEPLMTVIPFYRATMVVWHEDVCVLATPLAIELYKDKIYNRSNDYHREYLVEPQGIQPDKLVMDSASVKALRKILKK